MSFRITSELENLARKSGYSKSAEIIEEVLPKVVEKQADDGVPKVDNLDAPKELTPQERELFLVVKEFAATATDQIESHFIYELNHTPITWTASGDRITEYLKKKGLLKPNFKLRFGQEAISLLKEVDLDSAIDEERAKSGVLLFQLPKPLAHFWSKGAGDKGVDLQGMVIEWGSIYRSSTRLLWSLIDDYREKGLRFQRINPSGIHDPDKYYYVWLLGDEED